MQEIRIPGPKKTGRSPFERLCRVQKDSLYDLARENNGPASPPPDFLYAALDTKACAAFIKESRMKFANANKVDRKSGVRFGEPGAPVQGEGLR